MVLGRRWVLKNNFDGLPKKEDFQLVEEELPELKDDEFIFHSSYISVDPYQRPYSAQMTPPLTMIGSSLAVVEQSKNSSYPEGSEIIIYAGWVERGVADPTKISRIMMAPDIGSMSKSLLLGACGMPGNTAFFGFLELCDPKEGETLVVNGAAGAVGSLVGQIAKIKGCNVIGYAGTEAKCDWLRSIGFDKAYNYKTTDIGKSLKEAAPKGVDCYFDNVGGEMSATIMQAMNTRGRVSVCGAISHYNDQGGFSKVTDILPLCIFKELRVEGFLVTRWMDRYNEGVSAMAKWISEGNIKVRETVLEGFQNTPTAFIGLFTGENIGKMIVKV